LGSVITLTTDFGIADGYQAVLEGVIAGINPKARTIAISHDVPPGDIAGGRYLLKTHHLYFPPGTIHLAVVDPGVGSRRKIIAVNTGRYMFVAPDNGLLSFIPEREILSIYSITDRRYALASVSPVFHGRDIMAPAAAFLSLGVDPACLGQACKKMVILPPEKVKRSKGRLKGRIIWVDRFGNLIINIPEKDVAAGAEVWVNRTSIGPMRRTFSDVKPGRPLAYIGSGGQLEIAVRGQSALSCFGGNREDIEIEVAPIKTRS
jgi:S-adenosyl-L-methionine hydrolase (adenosine-forming)